MATTMSTPVHQLPAAPPTKGPMPAPDEDPVVRDVLREMEQEVAAATRSQPPPRSPPAPPAAAPAPWAPAAERGWWDADAGKRAALATAIAIVVFHPRTMQMILERIPAARALETYDGALRACLFAAVIYLLLTRLEL